jgi:hypothetical protein
MKRKPRWTCRDRAEEHKSQEDVRRKELMQENQGSVAKY